MTAGARQARYRERQARGLAVAPLEVDLLTLVELLIAEGRLERREREDFTAISAAATRFFAEVVNQRYASLQEPRQRW